MLSDERVARRPVVERFPVKMDDAEVPPVMLAVAGGTRLTAHGSVVATLCLDPRRYFRVADQATIVRDRFPDRMTFRAILNPLEIRVRGGQFPR